MKKVLFATSALVATAGMAAADVSVGGSARIGLVYDGSQADREIRTEKRMTINIDGSGSTDGGLNFGGRIRLRSDENNTTAISGANVFIGTDSWRLTVGNTNAAINQRVNTYGGFVGLTGLSFAGTLNSVGTDTFNFTEFSSRGQGADVARLDFTVGDFGASVSYSGTGDFSTGGGNETAEVAVSYNFGDWTVAAGAAGGTQADSFLVSVNGSIGDFGVGIGYVDIDNTGSKVVVHGSYSFGDTSVTAYIASVSEDTAGSAVPAGGDDTAYGIGFSHSLGGATLVGGIESGHDNNTRADLGIRFGF